MSNEIDKQARTCFRFFFKEETMIQTTHWTTIICAVFVLVFVGSSVAEIPQIISYQGKLTDTSGDPVADGSYDIRFKIFNAGTGGIERWDSGVHSVAVQSGIFNILLGESPQPSLNLAFDEDYWLEVTVESDVQSPRTKLGSVGYAFIASGLIPGTVVEGEIDCAISGITTKTSGVCFGGFFESESSEGTGLRAWATAPGGVTYGIYGRSYSTTDDARGVYGRSMASTGITYGVYGMSDSDEGVGVKGHAPYVGVFGEATTNSGETYGVYGTSSSTSGQGVYGEATATDGQGIGGKFESASCFGIAVSGYASNTLYTNYGGHFQTAGTTGMGVYGRAISSTGTNYGVFGESESNQGIGVRGIVESSTGTTYGGRFTSSSSSGIGVYGGVTANSGINYGGRFETESTSGRACYGWATATSGETYGGVFKTDSPDGYGVWARASATTGESIAGYFETSSSEGRGIIGIATATDGPAWGVYGRSSSNEGYGVAGAAWATTGAANGGFFYTNSGGGSGVRAQGPLRGVCGYATRTTGSNYGVYGHSESDQGKGVQGESHYIGVYGVAYTTTGLNYGGSFSSNSSSGTGVYATAPEFGIQTIATGSNGIGIYASGGSNGYAADFRGNVRIRSADTGDTIMELGEGLDYAEGFDISDEDHIEHGTVLIIDREIPGQLCVSTKPYDRSVAGIVAGANGMGSGVRLGSGQFEYDVALAGRVYCNVVAGQEDIEPGDLLTTSTFPGHAMKATDVMRSHGAILGKAMEPLKRGQRNRILVLVTLQ